MIFFENDKLILISCENQNENVNYAVLICFFLKFFEVSFFGKLLRKKI